MSLKTSDLIACLEEYAPLRLAEDWDNVGLQIGDPFQEVTGVLVTLDVTTEVVQEAVKNHANVIVAHHPVLFKPLKQIRRDSDIGGLVYSLIENKINLYVAHTNLDSAQAGVNQVLAEKLGLQDIEVLAVKADDQLVKIVTFVPEGHQQNILDAMSRAGAGHIGNYSHCTFQTRGTGSFLPLEDTKPFIGQQGNLEFVEEIRLETIASKRILGQVISAMLAAHPYEEVAYDLYPLLNERCSLGLGRIGNLQEEMSFQQLAQYVKEVLGLAVVHVGGDVNRPVNRVAVCGGSGVSLASNAIKKGAQVLVTGDIKYHEAQGLIASGINFIDAGHYETERIIIDVLAIYLKERVNVPVNTSCIDINPRKVL